MDLEMLEIFLDFAVTSLYGKVGSASLLYQIKDYLRKSNDLTL